jgi:Spy/CpxP family protein refolding chaperone
MNLKKTLVMAGMAALLSAGADTAMAQPGGGGGGGGFDPAQFMQRRMDRVHEQMGVTNDTEWNVIEGRLQKVFEAQAAMFGFRGRGGGGRQNGGGGDNAGGGGGRRGFGGPPSPELESLQNAVENNAPTAQIKAAMEKLRAARKAKEAELVKAQDDLKAILTVKQEAVAVSNGLIN